MGTSFPGPSATKECGSAARPIMFFIHRLIAHYGRQHAHHASRHHHRLASYHPGHAQRPDTLESHHLAGPGRGPAEDLGPGRLRAPLQGLLLRLSRQLDLDAAQQERLAGLLCQLAAQRSALRAWLRDPARLRALAGDNLDRAALLADYEAHLDALRRAGPALIDASGDFFDQLDFEQQQVLRFALRRGVRGARRCGL